MSWLFSQALEAAFSAGTCSDGEPCAQLNVMPTAHPFWHRDKTMEPYRFSRSGLTSRLLTDAHGEELLTWFQADFLARTSAPQDPATDSRGSDRDSGHTWRGSFARYDHDACSWKTAQCSLLEDSDEYSETWPRWGSMRAGVAYPLPTQALPISETDSGLWPTPTVCGNYNKPGKGKSGTGLATAVTKWPTPTASACKGSSPGALKRKDGRRRDNDRLDHAVMSREGGQLNPEWVEWLMGWPIGWTALKPLEMDRFREWQQQHSTASDEHEIAASQSSPHPLGPKVAAWVREIEQGVEA
ncbi:hypothetical protein M1D97_10490 [Kushneria sp. AK178]